MEINQPGIDIYTIIKENNLNPYYKIETKIKWLTKSYKGELKIKLSEEEKSEVNNLGIKTEINNKNKTKNKKKTKITKSIEILETLKQNGVDISGINIGTSKNGIQKVTLLKDIQQPGVDIFKIIEDNNLNPDTEIGTIIKNLRSSYRRTKSRMTDDERRKADELGLMNIKTKTTKTLEVLECLKQNGIDVSKIKMMVRRNGKREGVLLKEIQQPGLDIMKIIQENNLNPDESIGIQIANINQSYKGDAHYVITEEEKQKAKELGIIRDRLSKKEKEQQELKDKLEEAKDLKEIIQRNIKGEEFEK